MSCTGQSSVGIVALGTVRYFLHRLGTHLGRKDECSDTATYQSATARNLSKLTLPLCFCGALSVAVFLCAKVGACYIYINGHTVETPKYLPKSLGNSQRQSLS